MEPGAEEVLLAAQGLPGSHVGLEESAGVAVSPLRAFLQRQSLLVSTRCSVLRLLASK